MALTGVGVALLAAAAAPAIGHAEDAALLGGGSGIVVGNSSRCTLTTIGNDAAGRLVGFTAGHCGEPGASVVAEAAHTGEGIGRVVDKNAELDYAIIEFDPNRITPTDRLGDFAITEVGAPAQFPATVCKKGRTTGTNCGLVWGDVLASGRETWTQTCVLPGDSGGPIVAGSRLVGMVNAYVGVGCIGPEVGTDIAAVLRDVDARAGVGAGFQPTRN
ncbi:serine protease [Nocardia jejuensis]|uniref:serine protease n=1 Tax=Nocardia jejuensis TaxID=328049 RepID=UPI0012FBF69C